jgi:hypothetical protein
MKHIIDIVKATLGTIFGIILVIGPGLTMWVHLRTGA